MLAGIVCPGFGCATPNARMTRAVRGDAWSGTLVSAGGSTVAEATGEVSWLGLPSALKTNRPGGAGGLYSRGSCAHKTACGVGVLVFCNELRGQRCGRSIPAAKKADAALRVALSRPGSTFFRRSCCNSADSSDATPARVLVSISLWRPYLRTVSAVPAPGRSVAAWIADRSACFPRASATIGTARLRNSGGCFVGRATTPSCPADENWRHTGAAQDFLVAGFRAGWV